MMKETLIFESKKYYWKNSLYVDLIPRHSALHCDGELVGALHRDR